MRTVKVKVHPDTYRLIKETADKENDTVEDFLEDFIEGSFGSVGPDENDDDPAVEVVETQESRSLVKSNQSRTLAHIPQEYRKQIEDMLDEQANKGREERMMSALKYVVQQLMTTPGTGDRRDWAQQMLQNICEINGDPYTTNTAAALDSLLKRSGYMDLFSFGRTNPPVPDMMNPGDGR